MNIFNNSDGVEQERHANEQGGRREQKAAEVSKGKAVFKQWEKAFTAQY